MTSQETQDLKEILENLSASVHEKDLAELQISDWNALSENERNSYQSGQWCIDCTGVIYPNPNYKNGEQ